VSVEFARRVADARYSELLKRVTTDPQRAVPELENLISQGYRDCFALAGFAHEKLGNHSEALALYERGFEERGQVSGAMGAARILYLGLSGEKNHARAYWHYSELAEATGRGDALMMMGLMKANGLGVEKDEAEGEWLLRLAEAQGVVLATTYLARLDWHRGRYARSVARRFRAVVRALRLYRKDRRDPRLASVPPV